MSSRVPPHEVVVLALDGVVGLELGLPHRLLGIAEDAAGRRLYRVRTATVDGGPVRAADGWRVQVDHDLSVLADAGTVVVPGMEDADVLRTGTVDPRLTDALRAVSGRARLVSLCTGASVLAAAGLLDGRPAATHWRDTDRFRELFPAVHLDPDVLFVDDGDVLSSAGVAAGVDLLLHLRRRCRGRGATSSRRGGRAARPSSSPLPCPRPTAPGPRRPGPGRWSGWPSR